MHGDNPDNFEPMKRRVGRGHARAMNKSKLKRRFKAYKGKRRRHR